MTATFDNQLFFQISTGFGENTSKHLCSYNDDSNLIADIKASGFFDKAAPKLNHQDLIYICASDEQELVYVATVDPVTVVDLVTSSSATIPDGSVTHAKLAVDSVDTNNIKDSAVVATKLSTNAVYAGNIADNAVTNSKILDSSITNHKLNLGSVGYLAYKGSATATATTTQDITVTGASVGDVAYAVMTAGFSQPIVGVVAGENKVTIHYAAAAAVTDTVEVAVFLGGAAL